MEIITGGLDSQAHQVPEIRWEQYGAYKSDLDWILQQQAESFVKVGYMLKVARDTGILFDSGYATVAEFAKAEYGMSEDVVSRYIAINDRYSENGYSEKLQGKYQSFGYTKLAEMLTLPDEVIEAIPLEMTRKDIREIKQEIKEEQQITDLEVLIEGQKPELDQMDLLQKMLYEYLRENRNQYVDIYEAINAADDYEERFANEFSPSGAAVKMSRVQGIGKLMLTVRERGKAVELLNIRSGEKEVYSWDALIRNIQMFCYGEDPKRTWEELFGEPFEKQRLAPAGEEKVPEPKHPVQPRPEVQQAAEKVEESEQKTEPEKNKEFAPAQEVEEEPDGEQSEGSGTADGNNWGDTDGSDVPGVADVPSSMLEENEADGDGMVQQQVAEADSAGDGESENQESTEEEIPQTPVNTGAGAACEPIQDTIENHQEVMPPNYIKCPDGSEVEEAEGRRMWKAATLCATRLFNTFEAGEWPIDRNILREMKDTTEELFDILNNLEEEL